MPLMLTGLGAALLFIPLTTAVLGGVPRDQSARASAYTNLAVQLGGSIAIAALSTLIARRTAFHLNALADAFVPGTPGLVQVQPIQPEQLLSLANVQAIVQAYADATYVIALACFVSIALVFLMPGPRKGAAGAKR
jgi:DHA2 family multidrug resistance protein